MLDSLREREGGREGKEREGGREREGEGGRERRERREYKFIIIMLLLLVTVRLQSVVVYVNCSVTGDWLDAHLVHDSITNQQHKPKRNIIVI